MENSSQSTLVADLSGFSSEGKNGRKLRNVFVGRKDQVRLLMPSLIMIVTADISILLVYFRCLQNLETYVPEVSSGGSITLSYQLLLVSVACIFAVGIIGLGILLFWSHRIFGPIVAIRRHIQNLMVGKYSEELILRKADSFQELAADLRSLTEALRKNQPPKA